MFLLADFHLSAQAIRRNFEFQCSYYGIRESDASASSFRQLCTKAACRRVVCRFNLVVKSPIDRPVKLPMGRFAAECAIPTPSDYIAGSSGCGSCSSHSFKNIFVGQTANLRYLQATRRIVEI